MPYAIVHNVYNVPEELADSQLRLSYVDKAENSRKKGKS